MKQAGALGEDRSGDRFGLRHGAGGTMGPKASRRALRGNTESGVQSKAPLEGRGGKGGQALVLGIQAPLQPRGGPKSLRVITLCTPLRHRDTPQAVTLRAGPPPSTLRLTPRVRVSLLPP